VRPGKGRGALFLSGRGRGREEGKVPSPLRFTSSGSSSTRKEKNKGKKGNIQKTKRVSFRRKKGYRNLSSYGDGCFKGRGGPFSLLVRERESRFQELYILTLNRQGKEEKKERRKS